MAVGLINWSGNQFSQANGFDDWVNKLRSGDGRINQVWQNTLSQQRAGDYTGYGEDNAAVSQVNARLAVYDQEAAASRAATERATADANSRAQSASLAAQQAQAQAAQRAREIEAANVAAEAIRKANEAKKLFRGNMAQLGMNSQLNNTPSVVGGATAQAQGNPEAQGANTNRPRARRTAIASQLGVGV